MKLPRNRPACRLLVFCIATIVSSAPLAGCLNPNFGDTRPRGNCPHCGTLNIAIHPEELPRYEGRLTCYRCKGVFTLPGWGGGGQLSSGAPAQAEYSAALQAYQAACDELNAARSVHGLSKLAIPDSPGEAALALFTQFGSHAGVQAAENKVQAAYHRLETARARLLAEQSRPQVYVNVNEQRPQQLRQTTQPQVLPEPYYRGEITIDKWVAPPASFTCAGAHDTNGDGFIGKDELQGLGTRFSCSNPGQTVTVLCGAVWDNIAGKTTTGQVIDEQTNRIVIVKDESAGQRSNIVQWIPLSFKKLDTDSGIHAYRVEWMVDGRPLPNRTVRFFVDYGTN